MAERGKHSASGTGWRYAFRVLARSLTVPLLLAAGVSAFWLARSLYAWALALGENLGQVFAFFALFGAISFFAKLGLSQLNEHLLALLRGIWNYFRSIFSRDPAIFAESLRALARRLIPVLVLTRERKFNDRPGGYPAEAGSLPQDFLTRAAYVNVLSAAKCAPD